jgi:hypothetical protein
MDQILVTVSERAGQTFEPDMEESGAPKKKEEKKEFAYLPTHTQKSWVGFGQTEIFVFSTNRLTATLYFSLLHILRCVLYLMWDLQFMLVNQ